MNTVDPGSYLGGGSYRANGVGTNFGVGVARRAGDGVLGKGQPAPLLHKIGGLRERYKLPSGVRAEPRPPKGFLVFCAVRVPFPASQYVPLRGAYSMAGYYIFLRGIYISISPHK